MHCLHPGNTVTGTCLQRRVILVTLLKRTVDASSITTVDIAEFG